MQEGGHPGPPSLLHTSLSEAWAALGLWPRTFQLFSGLIRSPIFFQKIELYGFCSF